MDIDNEKSKQIITRSEFSVADNLGNKALNPTRRLTSAGINEPRTADLPTMIPENKLSSALKSLYDLNHTRDLGQDSAILLAQVAEKMRDLESANQKHKIQIDSESVKIRLEEKQAKLKEAQEKIDAANKLGQASSILNIITSILGSVTAITSVVLLATGIGAPLALIFIAAVNIIVVADGLMTSITGAGIAEHIALALNVDKKTAKTIDLCTKIALSLAAILTSFSIANVAEVQSAATKMVTDIIQIIIVITNGSSGVLRYASTMNQAEAYKIRSIAKENQAFIQQQNDMIDQDISRLKESGERFNQILDSIISSESELNTFLSRVKFST